MTKSILFVGLGETETPAFRAIAKLLASRGHKSTVVTLLPRLAVPPEVSIAEIIHKANKTEAIAEHLPEGLSALLAAGFPTVAYAAHYDRDWHYAGWEQKRRHVTAVTWALQQVLDEFCPSTMISSVGGETVRVVADALCRSRGIETRYLNALPVASRFVVLPRLDAPFVPFRIGAPPPAGPMPSISAEPIPVPGVHAAQSLVAEGLTRIWQSLGPARTAYPSDWIVRKTAQTLRRRTLRRLPSGNPWPVSPSFKLLYPLHDERDFQVAVRERHAIPQASFLQYVASVLPSHAQLIIKPHPQHSPDHHELLWRDVVSLPNVTMLSPAVTANSAIAQSDAVLTLASSLGYEALSAGKPVICYGGPFYSHRGLTIDVADIRDISSAVSSAGEFEVNPELLSDLNELMLTYSFPGDFSPIITSPENLRALAAGIVASIDADG